MTGYLKWRCEHTGYLRLGQQCRAYGDKWTWGVQIVRMGPRDALVEGLHGEVKAAHWRGVERVLAANGFDRMGFERLNEETGQMDMEWHRIRVRQQTQRKDTDMEDRRMNILSGDIVVVGEDGSLRNHFPGSNHFGVKESAFLEIQGEYAQLVEDLTTLYDLPKPAADEKRCSLLIGDTFVVDSENGRLRIHQPGAKYFGLAESVFVAMEKKIAASQKRLNEMAKRGYAAAVAAATPAAA